MQTNTDLCVLNLSELRSDFVWIDVYSQIVESNIVSGFVLMKVPSHMEMMITFGDF